MNLILLSENDFVSEHSVRLCGRRLQHILEVHQAQPGDKLRIGLVNGLLGEGTVSVIDGERLEMETRLHQPPPTPLSCNLLLALPRPKMLKRVLQSVTSLGVKQIYLINSYRVEKSFWGSPLLQPEKLREHLLLGLEQACDTLLPEVHLRQRFKPFVEDELPGLTAGTKGLVAHPAATQGFPREIAEPTTLAIGPEGGFIPYELEKLQEAGFSTASLGERILRVETAVPVLLSRLLPT
ncbi:MAG: 16S rRNA (uracil(1498)-N(3))-methyltransferase [Desulfuromonas sp.]|nr:MAG: 16S rRNA (uracil(1498)-N(3))-methyltransferase [Desulfuromonas sp.]